MYDKDTKLVVVGLGYVGLPLAVAFSERLCVIGFDKNEEKVHALKNGIDDTNEVGSETLKGCDVIFTSDETDIKGADIYIVSVPTPIKSDKSPDLHPLISASICIGEALEPGALVIYESTVYPGLTEKVCIPLLEKHSKCKLNDTLWVGYSPERINPGDKVHTLSSIVKVVSGSTPEVCERVALLYQCIVEAGVHKVSSIKAAEAVKVCENSQRDINIAFMNELAMSLERMDICTLEVVEAMNTKWNALGFYPGLVGGHCISVDPYYYLHEAARLGYKSEIISASRRINEGMGEYIANKTIKQMILAGKRVKGAKVGILGFTFKENCPDIRNSKVYDIYKALEQYGVQILVHDPRASYEDVVREYNVHLISWEEMTNLDAIIIAVAHQEYIEMALRTLSERCCSPCVMMDIKGIVQDQSDISCDIMYCSL